MNIKDDLLLKMFFFQFRKIVLQHFKGMLETFMNTYVKFNYNFVSQTLLKLADFNWVLQKINVGHFYWDAMC